MESWRDRGRERARGDELGMEEIRVLSAGFIDFDGAKAVTAERKDSGEVSRHERSFFSIADREA